MWRLILPITSCLLLVLLVCGCLLLADQFGLRTSRCSRLVRCSGRYNHLNDHFIGGSHSDGAGRQFHFASVNRLTYLQLRHIHHDMPGQLPCSAANCLLMRLESQLPALLHTYLLSMKNDR